MCSIDKYSIYAKVSSELNLSKLNEKARFETIPVGTIKVDKVFPEYKTKMTKILAECKIN